MGLRHRARGGRDGRERGAATVDPEGFASFGTGSWIAEPARISCRHRIHVGSGVIINAGCWLSVVEEHAGRHYTPKLRIGDGSALGHDVVIACIGEVVIGREVMTSDRVFIGDTYHDYRDAGTPILRQPMVAPRPVRIGDGAFLGINTVVLPGVTVGDRAYVAASAVVTQDVPALAVVAGNPARIIRRWDPAAGAWQPG
jgi:acetyltransferase-like isoleucine patch superfamily enzyme